MWRFDNASEVGASDMDRRACPSYEAGFDACDPLGSVLECSGRGPARVFRRRCRSEGVDRSPYEDVPMQRSADGITRQQRALPNKSHFTLNKALESHTYRLQHEFSLSAAENGDYVMAHDPKRRSYQSTRKSNRTATGPMLVTTLSNTKVEESRLPKVEELFEKMDHEMMDIPKPPSQPLKSILNNPTTKSPPHSILKKPKNRSYQEDGAKSPERRRRQRASSESDNHSPYNFTNTLTYDSRFTNVSATTKRAKDNSGVGYSYGAAIAALGNNKLQNNKSPKARDHHQITHPIPYLPQQGHPATNHPVAHTAAYPVPNPAPHLVPHPVVTHPVPPETRKELFMGKPNLNHSPIGVREVPVLDMRHRQGTLPTSPAESPTLPVSSATADASVKKDKKPQKKKLKTKAKMKGKTKSSVCNPDLRDEDCHSRSPSPKLPESWTMETDSLMTEIQKLEKPSSRSRSPVDKAPHTPRHISPKRTLSPEMLYIQSLKDEPHESVNFTQPITHVGYVGNINIVNRGHSPTATAISANNTSNNTNTSNTNSTTNNAYSTNSTNNSNNTNNVNNANNINLNNAKATPKVAVNPPKKIPKEKREPTEANNYKQDPFITALNTINPFRAPTLPKDTRMILPDSLAPTLRVSLFPRVPPYIKFIGSDEMASFKVPLPIQKHLKWKLTTITPIVVKKTLMNSGFRLLKSDCETSECPQEETIDWIGIWGKHMKSLMFRAIKDGQKMNHFPGTFQIGRKDRLWRNLQKLVVRHGMKEFGIMPKTYVLPHDLKLLKQDWEKHSENNEKWIIKPPASARGTGIKVVSRWTQIPKKRSVVVQRYVSKPYLINGSKFDLRLYVLVTSIHPLRIYLYKDGLARFASVKYTNELSSLNDRYMHLTNYSINRLSKNYTPNEDYAACEGHKWTLQTLLQYLKTERGVNTHALWESMKDVVIKTIISGEASISSLTKANVTSRYNCYELFGVDVLLDEDLKPWLLEVNISPSLHSASPLDIHVKGPMVTTVLNIAQFQVPAKTNLDMLVKEKPHKLEGLPYDSRLYTVYLSKEERDKHIIYTNMEDRQVYLRDILSTLTPDDVRHLIQAEDELTQAGDMERIFPTHETHKYLNYLAGPRYYNRLFDAWEIKYTHNREAGRDLLRNLCDIGYHLEVPPVPLKRAAPQLSALDRCRMMWTRRRRMLRSGLRCIPSHRLSPRSPRSPYPRPTSAATPSRPSRPARRPSNRAHSATPQILRATAEGSSNNVHMDTTTESQRKCTTSADFICAETQPPSRNVQCAETSDPLAQTLH